MDIEEIKKILKNSTAILVIDSGEPSFVIMNYRTYKELAVEDDKKEIRVKNIANGISIKQNQRDGEVEILDRINKEILALKDEIEKEEKSLYQE